MRRAVLVSLAATLPLLFAAAPTASAGKDDLPPVQSVACGDFDGDGTIDVAVGLPQAKAGKLKKAGVVRLFSGKTGELLLTHEGTAREEEHGGAMAAVGDLNGDGATDLALGRPWAEKARVDYVCGKTGTLIHSIPGGASFLLGSEVVALGDGSGTDVVDCILRAGGSGRMYYGLSKYAGIGRNINDQGGVMAPVAYLGDINGDGAGDFGVCAWAEGKGRLRVVSGLAMMKSKGENEIIELLGKEEHERLGLVAGPAGDWNGDGKGDILVGHSAFGTKKATDGSWRVRVLSGADGAELWKVHGEAGDISIGGVVLLGDVNGDEKPDVAVGSPAFKKDAGALRVLSGKDGAVLWSLEGARKEQLAEELYAIDDSNGDKVRDLVVISPGAKLDGKKGKGYVRIVSGKDGTTLTVINPLSKK